MEREICVQAVKYASAVFVCSLLYKVKALHRHTNLTPAAWEAEASGCEFRSHLARSERARKEKKKKKKKRREEERKRKPKEEEEEEEEEEKLNTQCSASQLSTRLLLLLLACLAH